MLGQRQLDGLSSGTEVLYSFLTNLQKEPMTLKTL